jgi:hypothetical protein
LERALSDADGGVAAYINATLWNPSIVGLVLGSSATFQLFYEGSFMGQVSGRSYRQSDLIRCADANATILPGNNFLQLSGFLKPTNLNATGKFVSAYLSGVASSAQVVGFSVGTPYPWLQVRCSNEPWIFWFITCFFFFNRASFKR